MSCIKIKYYVLTRDSSFDIVLFSKEHDTDQECDFKWFSKLELSGIEA